MLTYWDTPNKITQKMGTFDTYDHKFKLNLASVVQQLHNFIIA